MHIIQTVAFQLGKNLTFQERLDATHNVAAPKLYKYSNAAYYSESEYTADDWKLRCLSICLYSYINAFQF